MTKEIINPMLDSFWELNSKWKTAVDALILQYGKQPPNVWSDLNFNKSEFEGFVEFKYFLTTKINFADYSLTTLDLFLNRNLQQLLDYYVERYELNENLDAVLRELNERKAGLDEKEITEPNVQHCQELIQELISVVKAAKENNDLCLDGIFDFFVHFYEALIKKHLDSVNELKEGLASSCDIASRNFFGSMDADGGARAYVALYELLKNLRFIQQGLKLNVFLQSHIIANEAAVKHINRKLNDAIQTIQLILDKQWQAWKENSNALLGNYPAINKQELPDAEKTESAIDGAVIRVLVATCNMAKHGLSSLETKLERLKNDIINQAELPPTDIDKQLENLEVKPKEFAAFTDTKIKALETFLAKKALLLTADREIKEYNLILQKVMNELGEIKCHFNNGHETKQTVQHYEFLLGQFNKSKESRYKVEKALSEFSNSIFPNSVGARFDELGKRCINDIVKIIESIIAVIKIGSLADEIHNLKSQSLKNVFSKLRICLQLVHKLEQDELKQYLEELYPKVDKINELRTELFLVEYAATQKIEEVKKFEGEEFQTNLALHIEEVAKVVDALKYLDIKWASQQLEDATTYIMETMAALDKPKTNTNLLKIDKLSDSVVVLEKLLSDIKSELKPIDEAIAEKIHACITRQKIYDPSHIENSLGAEILQRFNELCELLKKQEILERKIDSAEANKKREVADWINAVSNELAAFDIKHVNAILKQIPKSFANEQELREKQALFTSLFMPLKEPFERYKNQYFQLRKFLSGDAQAKAVGEKLDQVTFLLNGVELAMEFKFQTARLQAEFQVVEKFLREINLSLRGDKNSFDKYKILLSNNNGISLSSIEQQIVAMLKESDAIKHAYNHLIAGAEVSNKTLVSERHLIESIFNIRENEVLENNLGIKLKQIATFNKEWEWLEIFNNQIKESQTQKLLPLSKKIAQLQASQYLPDAFSAIKTELEDAISEWEARESLLKRKYFNDGDLVAAMCAQKPEAAKLVSDITIKIQEFTQNLKNQLQMLDDLEQDKQQELRNKSEDEARATLLLKIKNPRLRLLIAQLLLANHALVNAFTPKTIEDLNAVSTKQVLEKIIQQVIPEWVLTEDQFQDIVIANKLLNYLERWSVTEAMLLKLTDLQKTMNRIDEFLAVKEDEATALSAQLDKSYMAEQQSNLFLQLPDCLLVGKAVIKLETNELEQLQSKLEQFKAELFTALPKEEFVDRLGMVDPKTREILDNRAHWLNTCKLLENRINKAQQLICRLETNYEKQAKWKEEYTQTKLQEIPKILTTYSREIEHYLKGLSKGYKEQETSLTRLVAFQKSLKATLQDLPENPKYFDAGQQEAVQQNRQEAIRLLNCIPSNAQKKLDSLQTYSWRREVKTPSVNKDAQQPLHSHYEVKDNKGVKHTEKERACHVKVKETKIATYYETSNSLLSRDLHTYSSDEQLKIIHHMCLQEAMRLDKNRPIYINWKNAEVGKARIKQAIDEACITLCALKPNVKLIIYANGEKFNPDASQQQAIVNKKQTFMSLNVLNAKGELNQTEALKADAIFGKPVEGKFSAMMNSIKKRLSYS